MNSKESTSSRQERKSPNVAMIWSVVCAGLGQFYNGDVPKGGAFLIAAILSWIVFWPLWIPVALWSIADAHTRAEEINGILEVEEIEVQHEKERENVIASTKTRVSDFIVRANKFSNLNNNNLLSEDEFRLKISELINELNHKKAFENPDDFLTELIPLVASGALNSEDITKIKSLIY
ncbi:hypothetical protein [Massilia sp. DWR3-1-1]|uniref:hypothetical protein n=1 Tax=Massilia sp. DWR3-1-1 TaxID=2804559 RepID=UPI003CE6D94C